MGRLIASTLTVAFVTLCVSGAALGQYQLGNGRALDRNLRAGSGGVNDGGSGNNYGRYQDALVTGNVGGLARFRGNIGYRAPGEFSGDLPSNNNFRFYLDSLPPAPTGYAVPGSQGLLPQANQQGILYRAGGGVQAGQVTGQTLGGVAGVPLYSNDVNGLNMSSAGYGGAMPMNLSAISTPQPLATGIDASGKLLQITATPLTGVRTTTLGAVELPTDAVAPKLPDKPGSAPDSTHLASPTGPGVLPQPGASPFDTPTLPDGTPAPDARLNANLAPTLQISTQLDANSAAADPRRRPGDFRADILDRQLFHPEGWSNAKPGTDVYADLLARANGQSGATAPFPGAPTTANAPGTVPPDRLGAAPIVPGKEPPKTGVDKIAQDFEKTNKTPDVVVVSPISKPATEDQKNVDALMDKLAYNVPPLPTLVGSGSSPFNSALADAEKHMAEGKYFNAEDSYLRAMGLRPGHPLAEIGRVHAQIGAGLYLSAGFNLRRILLNNPQIIAARFTGPLLPDAKRLTKIDEELSDLQKRSPNEDAALVQAYLAYQHYQPDKIQECLDIMLAKNPSDPLVPVIRRIWVGKTGPAKPAPVEAKPDKSGKPGKK